jgi:hypothetical protein
VRSLSNIAAKLKISKVSNFAQRRRSENARVVRLYWGDVTDIGRSEGIREDGRTRSMPEAGRSQVLPESERDLRALHDRHTRIHKWSPRQTTIF